MGTVTETIPPITGGSKPPVSRGGVRFETLIGKHLMGATYATGGDTVTQPAAPPGGVLQFVRITPVGLPAGFILAWDGNIAPVKILAYDPVTGTHAQLANASAALAAVVVWIEWVYKIGG